MPADRSDAACTVAGVRSPSCILSVMVLRNSHPDTVKFRRRFACRSFKPPGVQHPRPARSPAGSGGFGSQIRKQRQWQNRRKNRSSTVHTKSGKRTTSPRAGTKSSTIKLNKSCATKTNPLHCALQTTCKRWTSAVVVGGSARTTRVCRGTMSLDVPVGQDARSCERSSVV
jgi:hypothetical protein